MEQGRNTKTFHPLLVASMLDILCFGTVGGRVIGTMEFQITSCERLHHWYGISLPVVMDSNNYNCEMAKKSSKHLSNLEINSILEEW